MKPFALFLSAAPLMLAACASTAPAQQQQPSTTSQVGQAVTTPLADLNLVKAEIPPVLIAAKKGPYGPPADRSCAALGAEIQALDAVLGADLDQPPTPTRPSLIERGTDTAGDAAVGAVRGFAEGVVPFRGWVRKLTGAERYSKEVSAAIAAGGIRRAFLKGLGAAAGCPAPAAPRA
ncbi:MAG TPA: hypothetical protein VFV25_09840 [Methylibium sp.]